MHILAPADSHKNDSAAYKLANLLASTYVEEERRLIINYWRVDKPFQGVVTFKELQELHVGLPPAILELHRTSDIRSNEFTIRLNVSFKHYLGMCVELTSPDSAGVAYPFLANVEHVHTSIYPDKFSVAAIRYKLSETTYDGFPMANIDSYPEQLIDIELLETAWPGCGKHVPLMESLGYDDHEIVNTLLDGISVSETHVPPDDLGTLI